MIFKGNPVNIPYYFLSSLEKMAYAYQSNVADKEQSLFHHGIIKILVSYLLGELGDYWESFLPLMSLGKMMSGPNGGPKPGKDV